MPTTRLPITWATATTEPAATAALAAIADQANLRPTPDKVFRAFELVAPEAVKCVILAMDPYPNQELAVGVAFAVPEGSRTPPSLANIMAELSADVGHSRSTDLSGWASEGVLLANAALTMAGKTGEHKKIWQPFTRAWIAHLQTLDRPCIWLLWGNDAKAYRPFITGRNQRVIESAHPSRRSARRGFFGSRPFSQCNELLVAMGCEPIDWYAVTANKEHT